MFNIVLDMDVSLQDGKNKGITKVDLQNKFTHLFSEELTFLILILPIKGGKYI